jgi:hypothetical protein
VRSAPRGGRERGPGVRSPSGACGVSARWVLHIVRGVWYFVCWSGVGMCGVFVCGGGCMGYFLWVLLGSFFVSLVFPCVGFYS